ncbi:putative ABC transport system permease protein [Granulicella aggregans]|uniref:Putative ABC transport system permease protein n=1 Tax=Granulicella aggregans TaxID=474949 RepID=A0A7W7ZB57_9BACT|nr:ABC transporter permease [Granulicella aggregans]MBB5056640.1 putative ABC transport system permease protein [Granulicella aggregans]
MAKLIRNLQFTVRLLWKSPGLTITVLLTLALGIGANTAIFTVDYATLLAPLPYPNPDQLVVVWSKIQTFHNGISAGDFTDWKRMNRSFTDINAFTGGAFNIASKEQPENIDGEQVTPGYYNMLGIPFFLGRDFLPEEGKVGKDHEVILTHKLWSHLGADPKLVGQSMRINGEPYTVVGVLAPGVLDRGQAQVTVPLAFKPEQLNHDFHWLLSYARLKPGISVKQAQADMDAVSLQIAQDNPKSNKGWGSFVEPLKNDFMPSERKQTLWLLLGAVVFILLIACVNVANLLLARGMARQKELAVRSAMGASRRTIFEQLLTESLLLSFAGGLLGIGVGYGMLQTLVAIMPEGTLPTEADLHLNVPVLAFTLLATTIAGVLFGSAPAWYASRIDPAETLKEGGRTGMGAGRHRLRQGLVIGEFALALTLLAGAGLAIHSFLNLLRVDLGLRTDHILTFFLPVPDSRPKEPEKIIAYYRQMLERINAVPGVTSSTAMTGLPVYGAGFGMPFTIVGKPAFNDPSMRPNTGFGMATPAFFDTFGIKIVKGRGFTEQDTASSVKVAVVSEEFVKKYLSDTDPLQQRISVEQLIPGVTKLGPPQDWQIVGVYHNIRRGDLREDSPEMRIPFWQTPWPGAGIAVRTANDPASMTKSIADAVHSVDPEIALAEPRSMEEVRDRLMSNDRFTLTLFVCFSVVALLLAGLGVYGVMSFSVAQRSHEIALRMALGADRTRVVGLIVREGLILAGIGLALGLIGAVFVGRSMQSTLYGVGKFDVSVFASVALVLVASALVACVIPAQRAASVQPMRALRAE